MSNLFAGLPTYGGKWSLKDSRKFNAEEKSSVSKVQVVESNYGLSACFSMVSGGVTYIPMSTTANVRVGDILDINKCDVLTLSKQGEQDILRLDY